jgi:hypothetical protein
MMRRVRQVRSWRKGLLALVVAVGALGASSSLAADGQALMFKVRIENISSGKMLKLSSGGDKRHRCIRERVDDRAWEASLGGLTLAGRSTRGRESLDLGSQKLAHADLHLRRDVLVA